MPRKRLSAVAPLDRCDELSNALQRSRSLLAQAEDLADFGVWEFEIPGLKLTCSAQTYRIFEHPSEPLLNLDTFFSFFDPDAAATIRSCFLTAVSVATAIDEILPFRAATGRSGWLRIMARATIAPSGRLHLVGLIKDVTREREAEQHLRSLAYQDGLTGLPNRRYFQDQLIERTAEEAQNRPFALMLIDLDGFRTVNDRHGHASGDAMLTEFADRLGAAISRPGTIARIGGDEFAIVLPGIDTVEDASRRAAMLRERVAEGRHRACEWPAVEPPPAGFTMGISLYPRDGTMPDQLYKAADMALCHAKVSGRNQTQVFRSEIRDEIERNQRMISELRVAIAEQQLVVYYQPIVDLRTSIIRGWEGLVRWRHPVRGLMRPGEFLPHLDSSDLAVDIDRYVLDRGLAQLRNWLDDGHPVTCVGINTSADQLRRGDFVDDIAALLAHYRLTPDRLKIEILESAFFGRNVGKVAETIARLSELGVVCALDDFGTGYASLTHLKQFKVERIKIDRSFIKNIPHDIHDKAITRSMIDLGRNLGIRVTAEGIETLDQLRIVQGFGCDCGQGYLFGRPMPADAVPAMLAAWNAGRAAEILGRAPSLPW